MLSYCPPYYSNSRVFKAYLQAVGPELDVIRQGVKDILNQFFVELATWALIIYEDESKIATVAGKPIDQRRSQIISKMRGMGTVTPWMIESVAESYGNGEIDIIEQNHLYKFIVQFVSIQGIPPGIQDIKDAISVIKPSHLGVEFVYQYLNWNVLDARAITGDELDVLGLDWDVFESGAWVI